MSPTFWTWVKNAGAILGVLGPLIAGVTWFIGSVKQDILNEFRNEAATVRLEFAKDVEERLDDVTFEVQRLQADRQAPSEYLLSKQKRLERRLQALKEAK